MKGLWRSSIFIGKNIFRDIGFTFWGLMYPIILAGFFYISFIGLTNVKLEPINIGVQKNNPVIFILEDIDILHLKEVSEENISESLANQEIDGYIRKDLSLVVDRSGLNQTIIKGIIDQILQTIALNEPLENLDFNVDYLAGKTQKGNGILVIFYALIAMVSTYGVFPGIETTNLSQANLSNIGARINVTPIKKSTLLASGMIVGLLINLFSNILLIIFLKYILKLELFTNFAYNIIFIVLGNIFGISLGIFIGSSNKKSSGVKTMMSIALTMFLSFLSGLMSPDTKILIDKNLPLLSKLNPIAIITNSLYRINLLENTNNLTQGMLLLLAYSLILMGVSYIFLRRRQYDSI